MSRSRAGVQVNEGPEFGLMLTWLVMFVDEDKMAREAIRNSPPCRASLQPEHMTVSRCVTMLALPPPAD
jgi:hypothetical protein